ncbi:MAG: aminoacyl-tRNA hydrolase [Thermoanaerobaculia bacterium]
MHVRLVAGLGNPGPEYEGTRHNVGFAVVDRLAGDAGFSVKRLDCRALTGRGRIENEAVVLAKPATYMNASGEAVVALLKKLELTAEDLLVVSDDIDLPVGALRLKPKGSSGGQKGLRSIESALGTKEFPRLRVGIRGEHYTRDNELSDYVLDRFSRSERPTIDAAVTRAADAVRAWLTEGIVAAMNRFNAISE